MRSRHHNALYCTHNDYYHLEEHCTVEACKQTNLARRQVQALEEANQLTKEELGLRERGEWGQERPRPRPVYVPPRPAPPAPPIKTDKGGMSIEPRNSGPVTDAL